MASSVGNKKMPDNLKEGWTRVAFGDVVRHVRDRVDPENTDLERYVAGEHMDTDDLRIRRWGLIGDGYLGPAFQMRFKAGQVLYGSRRTYLRKVAVADFEGITANTTFVLESKDPEVLLPQLLPFIMQSESFHEHSIKQSKGSVNPYINFSDLAWYEFALPPLDEQRRIAEVLMAATSASQLLHEAAVRAETCRESAVLRSLQGADLGPLVYDDRFGHHSPHLPLTPVGDLLTATQYGLSQPSTKGGAYRMLRMTDLDDGLAIDQDSCTVDLPDDVLERYRLDKGDVLFNRTNSHDLVGRTGVYRLEGVHVFASYLVRLKVNESLILPDYLCTFLNAPLGRRQVMRFATRAVSQTNVNASNLCNVLIPLPNIQYQEEVVGLMEQLRWVRIRLMSRESEAASLAARLAGEILEGTT